MKTQIGMDEQSVHSTWTLKTNKLQNYWKNMAQRGFIKILSDKVLFLNDISVEPC